MSRQFETINITESEIQWEAFMAKIIRNQGGNQPKHWVWRHRDDGIEVDSGDYYVDHEASAVR